MKQILMLATVLFGINTFAQGVRFNNDSNTTNQIVSETKEVEHIVIRTKDCPPPKSWDYKVMCSDITTRSKVLFNGQDFFLEYRYEKRLWEIACADPLVDDFETAKKKIQVMWEKYKKQFTCDTLGFNVQNGSFLKFAISSSMPSVIETMASTYELDINFIDPSDGKNLLDYVNGEIERRKNLVNGESAVAVYQRYKNSLILLGAKPSK